MREPLRMVDGAPESLRIALVTWNFPLLSEPFVTTLANDLVAADQDVRILTLDDTDKGDAVGAMHPEVEGSDLLARTGRAGVTPSLQSLLKEGAPALGLLGAMLPGQILGRARLALREGPFDIVHCQFASLGLAARGLRRAGMLRTRALVVHIRGYDITSFVEEQGRKVFRDLFRDADLMIANCRYFRDKAVTLGCPPEKIIVIGSPIDGALFVPPAARPSAAGRALRLISIGRLVDKKGFDDAIAAVGLLHARGRAVVFDIFGDGPNRAALERQIEGMGLQGVITCHGQATQAQIIPALHNADIALAPSVRAASGNEDAPVNTLKEAMATGLPVVATRHGGIPELVIPGENGLLVPERSPNDLADAIADLADRPEDWRRMGEAGRKRVLAEYDRVSVRDRTLAAYQACLEGRAAGRAASDTS